MKNKFIKTTLRCILLFSMYFGLVSISIGAEYVPSPVGDSVNGTIIRKDIIYPKPNTFKDISEYGELSIGDGRITGRILINDKPLNGLKICLLLDGGDKTHEAVVDKEGHFEVMIPTGKYLLNGVLCLNAPQNISQMIMINKVQNDRGEIFMGSLSKYNEVYNEFCELKKRFYPDYAEKLQLTKMIYESSYREIYPIEVSDRPMEIQDIVYRDPIKITYPEAMSCVSLHNLQFCWDPYPNARSYKIEIQKIEQKDSATTTHTPFIVLDDIQLNKITYPELIKIIRGKSVNIENAKFAIKPEDKFGFRVIGYDDEGEIISSSSESSSDLLEFTIGN